MSSIDPSRLIHVSAAPERAPRARLVPRVFDQTKRPDPKAAKYRLRKALTTSADRDTLRKAASALTSEERREVLEEIERDKIEKGYWDPVRHNYSALHPRPPKVREPARPKRQAPPMIGADRTGRRVRVERGRIIHFTSTEGDLVHARVTAWGARGITAIDRDGQAWGVLWSDVREGVHPSARDEHQQRLAKSQEVRRSREWSEQVQLLSMTPEARARFFAERDRDPDREPEDQA